MALTRRQREVLDFLQQFQDKNGYCPSFEEIASGVHLSSLATVHKHIANLESKGFLKRDYNRARSIDLVKSKAAPRRTFAAAAGAALPFLGRIAAGQPIEAIANPETISLGDFTGSKDVFVLEVTGESMQDEHIVDGDYVLVERTNTARDGEIVVALVNNSDTTLKRMYREGSMVRLQPSNSTMSPIMVPAEAVSVQGRVIGVLRKY